MTKIEWAILMFMWVLGSIGAWQYFQYVDAINNAPEKVVQRTVNKAIQSDLCERIEKDVQQFKDQPKTFRRTSLSSIDSESKMTLRYLLKSKGVPEDYPIIFRGQGSPFADCVGAVKEWLSIPSSGSQLISEELILAGLDGDRKGLRMASDVNTAQQKATGRVALVIGNSAYQNRPLKNARNDAEDIAAFLAKSDFEVITLNDATLSEMQLAIQRYAEKLMHKEVGLVFFAGHGVEFKGRNYLLPVDTNLTDEEDIPRQSIDASSLVERVSRAEGRLNIIIIDACRSNFIPSKSRSLSQGLAKMDGVRGTIVAFSTAPGMVAEDGNDRNSPYTKNLLKAMSVPGRKIEDVFKETAKRVEIETTGRQVPWYNSSILVDFSIQ